MNVKEALKKFEASILEDGRIDRGEAEILLNFARPLAGTDPEMAEFVQLLEKVLEDGKVTAEESIKVSAYLKWLAREIDKGPVQPNVGFFGKLFKHQPHVGKD